MAFIDHPEIASANVFAIDMKQYGYEGQVGCAAITFRGSTDPAGPNRSEEEALGGLEQYLTSKAGLAGYAVPRFLRVLIDVDADEALQREQIGISDDVGGEYVSSMLKKLKTGLRKEGTSYYKFWRVVCVAKRVLAFHPPQNSRDRIYWIEHEGQGYVPLHREKQEQLRLGKARL